MPLLSYYQPITLSKRIEHDIDNIAANTDKFIKEVESRKGVVGEHRDLMGRPIAYVIAGERI